MDKSNAPQATTKSEKKESKSRSNNNLAIMEWRFNQFLGERLTYEEIRNDPDLWEKRYKHINNFEEYMKELVLRLESEEFPHEIGIFLGYPLKDVLGFMGYGNKEFVEVCSWRIYGDKEISQKVYNRFVRDKIKMHELVEKMSINELRAVI